MKKVFILLLSLTIFSFVRAQVAPAEPPYKRFPKLPPFTLLGVDSQSFTREDLQKHKKTLIMYFSPECDHCKHQTEDMLKDIDKLKEIQIVMTTYDPFEEMATFYRSYNLAKYPNIKVGRDTKYFFGPFYQFHRLPYQALYDEKGKLITTFAGNIEIDKMAKAFDKKN